VSSTNSPLDAKLEATVDAVLETLPPAWDRIRSNIRAGATLAFGISLEQFHALRHIRRGFRTVKDLAERRQISRAAASQAVEALVRKRLVTRTPSDEDRRSAILELTQDAARTLDANLEATRAWMRGRMAALGGDELEALGAAMELLARTFAPDGDGDER